MAYTNYNDDKDRDRLSFAGRFITKREAHKHTYAIVHSLIANKCKKTVVL